MENPQNISLILQNHINKDGVEELILELKKWGIKNQKILETIKFVPRERFVKKEYFNSAYGNYPLGINCNQTISQPYIVAYMTEKLELKKSDKVLEIGTGSGYQTAILAKLSNKVFTVERFEKLYKKAKKTLSSLGIKNVYFKMGDGKQGWKENAPFDKIIITAAAKEESEISKTLFPQLKEGGIMVAPIGENYQNLYIFKKENDEIKKYRDISVLFVPLV